MNDEKLNINSELASENVTESTSTGKSPASDEAREQERDAKKRLVKLGILAAFGLIMVIFVTIAWFAMNKDIGASGMSVTASGETFNLATKGTTIRNNPPFEDLRPDYDPGVAVELIDNETGLEDDFYITGTAGDLMLRFTSETEDDPSTTDYDESIPDDIGPSSSGELNLYIVPSKSGPIDAYINLEVIAYTVIGTGDEAEIIEVNDDLDTSSGLTAERVAECKLAADYLNGHIMFFEEEVNNANYSYRKPITDHVIHFTQANAVAGRAYKVPVYWMWPNTLGQLALKTNALLLRDGKAVVEETTSDGTAQNPTDKRLVLDYLKDNKDIIFRNLDVESTLNEQEAEAYAEMTDDEKEAYVSSIIDSWIEAADTHVNFNYLSDGYNTADFTIGTNLNYFLIEATVVNN